MLECGTGIGVLEHLGCHSAGAISMDLHTVLLFTWCWSVGPAACRGTAKALHWCQAWLGRAEGLEILQAWWQQKGFSMGLRAIWAMVCSAMGPGDQLSSLL